MLKCKEQRNPLVVHGRTIRISDRVANAHYFLCNLPVDEGNVRMYLQFFLGNDYEEKMASYSDEELTLLVEKGVRREFFDLLEQSDWDNVGK